MVIDDELRDLGGATSLVVERLVGPVEGMHRAISGNAFRYVGPAGRPVQVVHDGMVGGVYRAIRGGAGLLGAAAGALAASRLPEASPVSGSRRGAGVQAALNGVWGDELDARGNELAVALSIRRSGRMIPVDRDGLADAYREPSDHIVVLLHGLGQTERCWTASEPGLLDQLAGSVGTPVLVRYNSGLPVERSGAELAELLEALVENWPVDEPRLSLVGYSMGGLVARSACVAASAAGHEWMSHARDLVTVGAPHHGSPIARAARLGSRALGIAATTRPLSRFIDTASAGIKDLEDGVADPEGTAGIRQHFMAAVVTAEERHPVGVVAGDLIVRVASAAGRMLGPSNVRVLGGKRHFSLLSDPEVADQIVAWLEDPGPR
ncbi:MAG: alpha/beta hydrolase [Acidimicrobiia bacterium]|nr:GPI inositol-deacylase [Acidimicrobiia bacterium]NNF88090.1 alpha/beta hydrolase [Acidimicrobiia bacterium]NNL12333.1 alpha/beta hydrolase [Acidimicrobiia bacterium]